MPEQFLSGRRPVPDTPQWQLLCIDDFVSLGKVPLKQVELASSGGEAVGPDLKRFENPLHGYAAEDCEGRKKNR